MDGIHKFIPLGYRCTSSGILRKLNLKLESYPFDWLISRLNVIKDCIETDYQHFLNIENYTWTTASTVHYNEAGSRRVICEECILFNRYYQPRDNPQPSDTYQYHLALNHRDLTLEADYSYMLRCIDRFKQILAEMNLFKISLYIHPVLSANTSTDRLVEEFRSFHSFLSERTSKLSGLYFILFRSDYSAHSTAECVWSADKCFIYVIQCSSELVDAGEIFQGECSAEINFISQKIRERIIEDSRDFLMGGC